MEPVTCVRCGAEIATAELESLEQMVGKELPVGPVQTPGGVLLTPIGALYCAGCAPDVRICRGCGCTDEAGCDEGCWWVEADLCSSCRPVPVDHPFSGSNTAAAL